MNWLNVSEELLNGVEAENVSTGSGVLESGVYEVKVNSCFIRKTDSGASMLELNTEDEDGNKVFWNTCLKSGDAKGNKSTYTDKKGKEQLLPGVVHAMHLFESCGLDLTKEEPQTGTVEYRDNNIEAGIFKAITGKKFKACVRQYEDEYNGEIKLKYDIENFLDVNGENTKGEFLEDKFLAKIEKSPVKLLKKKTGGSQPTAAAQAEAAQSGW